MSSTNGQIGFAVVGCGMIARFHARALAEVLSAATGRIVNLQ
jgi:ornithine cyclodeaminase/alanine dehydrogenase-like protein (mu-crystallin family)